MEVVETCGYVKKKEYDLLEKSYKNISYKVFGMRVMLKELEKKVELEYKRAEYWKAKHCIQIQNHMLKEIWKRLNI